MKCNQAKLCVWKCLPERSQRLNEHSTQRCPDLGQQGINGLPLGAPVEMIDTIALIVPLHQSRLHQIRDRSADAAPCGLAQPVLHHFVQYLVDRWNRQSIVPLQINTKPFTDRLPPVVPLRHRDHGLSQPVSHRYRYTVMDDVRTRDALFIGRLSDQIEYDKGISWAPRGFHDPLGDRWHFQSSLFARARLEEVRLVEHTTNLACFYRTVNPLADWVQRFGTYGTLP